MIGPAVLAALIQGCEPALPADLVPLQIGVVMTETAARLKWNPADASLTRAYEPSAWAIHDDNTDETYCVAGFSCPSSFVGVVSLAATLIARDQTQYGSKDAGVDLGLAQINSKNLASLQQTVPSVLHACSNLAASGTMLARTYSAEMAQYAPTPLPVRRQIAFDRTAEIYNSGRADGAPSYARNVFAAMTSRYAQTTIAAYRVSVPIAAPRAIAATENKPHPVMRTAALRPSAAPPTTQFIGSSDDAFAGVGRRNAFQHDPDTAPESSRDPRGGNPQRR